MQSRQRERERGRKMYGRSAELFLCKLYKLSNLFSLKRTKKAKYPQKKKINKK